MTEAERPEGVTALTNKKLMCTRMVPWAEENVHYISLGSR